tara:strand:+ start:9600 stop:10502 length:903 start_codon:yes stop_codon:yes gene_type:complete
MVSSDIFYQFIDWRHDQIDVAEAYDHEGTLSTFIIAPKISIGLSDWWNVTFQQIVGSRHMGWLTNELSTHHRNEGAHSDFDNALGGYLGDTKLIFRYLSLNAGRGVGSRLFFGIGYLFPSKNTLTKSPFLKNNDGLYFDHRHFSMSQGVQKVILEMQYYYKRSKNPVFIGGSLNIEEPVLENKYGFSGSRLSKLTLTIMNNNKNLINTPYSVSIVFAHESEAFWDGVPAPNSETNTIIPGLGFFWDTNFASLSLNLQYPIFLNVVMAESGSTNLNAEADAWQISLSIRKVLDYTIPWLYW